MKYYEAAKKSASDICASITMANARQFAGRAAGAVKENGVEASIALAGLSTGAYLAWMAADVIFNKPGPSTLIPWVNNSWNPANNNAQALANILILIVFAMALMYFLKPHLDNSADIKADRERMDVMARFIESDIKPQGHIAQLKFANEGLKATKTAKPNKNDYVTSGEGVIPVVYDEVRYNHDVQAYEKAAATTNKEADEQIQANLQEIAEIATAFTMDAARVEAILPQDQSSKSGLGASAN